MKESTHGPWISCGGLNREPSNTNQPAQANMPSSINPTVTVSSVLRALRLRAQPTLLYSQPRDTLYRVLIQVHGQNVGEPEYSIPLKPLHQFESRIFEPRHRVGIPLEVAHPSRVSALLIFDVLDPAGRAFPQQMLDVREVYEGVTTGMAVMYIDRIRPYQDTLGLTLSVTQGQVTTSQSLFTHKV